MSFESNVIVSKKDAPNILFLVCDLLKNNNLIFNHVNNVFKI